MKATIVEAHRQFCIKTNDPTGFIYEPNLDFLIFSAEKKKDKWKKAASYLHDIAILHPFQEGNKRTAFATSDAILHSHGFKCIATEEQITNFVVSVPKDKKTKTQVENWLRRNYRKF